jgi:hypothetical protein
MTMSDMADGMSTSEQCSNAISGNTKSPNSKIELEDGRSSRLVISGTEVIQLKSQSCK